MNELTTVEELDDVKSWTAFVDKYGYVWQTDDVVIYNHDQTYTRMWSSVLGKAASFQIVSRLPGRVVYLRDET